MKIYIPAGEIELPANPQVPYFVFDKRGTVRELATEHIRVVFEVLPAGPQGEPGRDGEPGTPGINGASVFAVQAASESEAQALSLANPNNIYFVV